MDCTHSMATGITIEPRIYSMRTHMQLCKFFAESVAVEEDGGLLMLDKYNYAWRAMPDAEGTYKLPEKPFAYLGVGERGWGDALGT